MRTNARPSQPRLPAFILRPSRDHHRGRYDENEETRPAKFGEEEQRGRGPDRGGGSFCPRVDTRGPRRILHDRLRCGGVRRNLRQKVEHVLTRNTTSRSIILIRRVVFSIPLYSRAWSARAEGKRSLAGAFDRQYKN